jgi:NAD(P)-dependent dehydrogenase (short-subunit alcohol dehydrogenase family)
MTVVMITGATDGLGRALARRVLEDTDATVLVHGRSERRIADTVAELDAGERVRAYRADFASLAQVRALAEELRRREERVDVLVNNAGIAPPETRALSEDGHELGLAVNHLAGFALTQRLLDRIGERIVFVSSLGQRAIDFDDVMLERGYSGMRSYCQSKLAQILYAFELAGRVDDVAVTALHPATYMPTKMVSSPISTLEEGVEATFRLVADPSLAGVTGRFFDGVREAEPDPQAADAQARRRLWELSERLTAG